MSEAPLSCDRRGFLSHFTLQTFPNKKFWKEVGEFEGAEESFFQKVSSAPSYLLNYPNR